MADFFTAAMGAVWIQPDGPNTEVQYLGCHDVAGIVLAKGAERIGPVEARARVPNGCEQIVAALDSLVDQMRD